MSHYRRGDGAGGTLAYYYESTPDWKIRGLIL